MALVIFIVSILLISSSHNQLQANSPNSVQESFAAISAFDFTLTNGTIVNILNFTDKPILLEWSASWCSICALNHDNIDTIYAEYKDRINFLSISYKGSGDDLSKVISMKGSYEWEFGLDHLNWAQTFNAQNADTWILYSNLTQVIIGDYSLLTVALLRSHLDNVLLDLNTTGTPSSLPPQELWALDLLVKNPLFLGFLGVMIVSAIGLILIRIRRQ
ncbi:MAG: TlpA family protein disulfide reductase [Candidatus Heimdallarchaeota archaeon]